MTSVALTSTGASTTDASASSTSRAEASTGSAAAESSSGGTTVRLDVGDGSDGGTGRAPGCRGKIDFLFVLSRAPQMGMPYENYGTVYERLVASAPEFLATIESTFADFDVHVLVTKGDAHWGSPYCDAECPGPFEKCGTDDYPCERVGKVPACDATWGAGVVFNAGWLAPNVPCDVPAGQRYISSEQANFGEAFTCTLQVGASGYYLVPQALAAAISPELTGPGGCNEGFLRDDALLVVTFVTTMLYDVDSSGSPQEWAQAVLDAKGGDAGSVVMLYIGPPGLDWCEQQKNNRACDFVEHFPRREVRSALEPTFGPAFEAAASLVVDACAEFIPQ